MDSASPSPPSRRRLLATTAALGGSVLFALRPSVAATTGDLSAAVSGYAGGAVVLAGKVKLLVSELVDNGNVVPITITVDSPMTPASHVKAIALFNEKNPQREVAKFALGPNSGRATVSTRIRLATTQKLVAVAQMNDGSFWSGSADVIVTLAACIEGEV
jgi:sulfur-oxidizing protein SoxY